MCTNTKIIDFSVYFSVALKCKDQPSEYVLNQIAMLLGHCLDLAHSQECFVWARSQEVLQNQPSSQVRSKLDLVAVIWGSRPFFPLWEFWKWNPEVLQQPLLRGHFWAVFLQCPCKFTCIGTPLPSSPKKSACLGLALLRKKGYST